MWNGEEEAAAEGGAVDDADGDGGVAAAAAGGGGGGGGGAIGEESAGEGEGKEADDGSPAAEADGEAAADGGEDDEATEDDEVGPAESISFVISCAIWNIATNDPICTRSVTDTDRRYLNRRKKASSFLSCDITAHTQALQVVCKERSWQKGASVWRWRRNGDE